MIVYCPSCGAPLEINSQTSILVCEYCGQSTVKDNFVIAQDGSTTNSKPVQPTLVEDSEPTPQPKIVKVDESQLAKLVNSILLLVSVCFLLYSFFQPVDSSVFLVLSVLTILPGSADSFVNAIWLPYVKSISRSYGVQHAFDYQQSGLSDINTIFSYVFSGILIYRATLILITSTPPTDEYMIIAFFIAIFIGLFYLWIVHTILNMIFAFFGELFSDLLDHS